MCFGVGISLIKQKELASSYWKICYYMEKRFGTYRKKRQVESSWNEFPDEVCKEVKIRINRNSEIEKTVEVEWTIRKVIDKRQMKSFRLLYRTNGIQGEELGNQSIGNRIHIILWRILTSRKRMLKIEINCNLSSLET